MDLSAKLWNDEFPWPPLEEEFSVSLIIWTLERLSKVMLKKPSSWNMLVKVPSREDLVFSCEFAEETDCSLVDSLYGDSFSNIFRAEIASILVCGSWLFKFFKKWPEKYIHTNSVISHVLCYKKYCRGGEMGGLGNALFFGTAHGLSWNTYYPEFLNFFTDN